MAIQANKPNSRIFLLLGVVLAAAAAVAVLLLVRSNAPANEVNVVVSDTSIPAGTTLTPAMVIVTQVPVTAKPGDAYTDPVAVVGKVTQVALADNTPIVPGFFSTPSLSITSSGTGTTVTDVESQITKGYVAVAIPTNAAVPTNAADVGAEQLQRAARLGRDYILPGDHIDILVQSLNGTLGVRYTFQDLIVLRVGNFGIGRERSRRTPSSSKCRAPRPRCSPPHRRRRTRVRGQVRPPARVRVGQAHRDRLHPELRECRLDPSIPVVKQTIVTPSTLDSLFGG